MGKKIQKLNRVLEEQGVNFFLVFIPYFIVVCFGFYLIIRHCLKSPSWKRLKKILEDKRKKSKNSSPGSRGQRYPISKKDSIGNLSLKVVVAGSQSASVADEERKKKLALFQAVLSRFKVKKVDPKITGKKDTGLKSSKTMK